MPCWDLSADELDRAAITRDLEGTDSPGALEQTIAVMAAATGKAWAACQERGCYRAKGLPELVP